LVCPLLVAAQARRIYRANPTLHAMQEFGTSPGVCGSLRRCALDRPHRCGRAVRRTHGCDHRVLPSVLHPSVFSLVPRLAVRICVTWGIRGATWHPPSHSSCCETQCARVKGHEGRDTDQVGAFVGTG
jgi:hypothetical protein